jgi:hypothetical protein
MQMSGKTHVHVALFRRKSFLYPLFRLLDDPRNLPGSVEENKNLILL